MWIKLVGMFLYLLNLQKELMNFLLKLKRNCFTSFQHVVSLIIPMLFLEFEKKKFSEEALLSWTGGVWPQSANVSTCQQMAQSSSCPQLHLLAHIFPYFAEIQPFGFEQELPIRQERGIEMLLVT